MTEAKKKRALPANRCNAKSKSTGEQCKNPAKPNGKCRNHGGNSLPAGPLHPNIKHGRYSKVKMPAKLAARYEEAMNDPEYLSMRNELALTDGMLAERLETMDEGGAGDLWKSARKTYALLDSAITSADLPGIRSAMFDLKDIINAGASEHAARTELRDLIKDRQRIAEGITKQIVTMRQVVTVEQSMVMMGRIIDMIENEVSDLDTRSVLLRGIIAMADVPEGVGSG